LQGVERGYASDEYRKALRDRGIVASVSRTADCYDNAVTESFFATYGAEHVDHEDFATRAIGTASMGDYLESFYNTATRHSHLGHVRPIELESRSHRRACGIVTLSTAAVRRRGRIIRVLDDLGQSCVLRQRFGLVMSRRHAFAVRRSIA
jgi:hypothetical protein